MTLWVNLLEHNLFILRQTQGNDRISCGSGGAWTDNIELQDGDSSLGEYETDWTISIDGGEVTNSGSDGDNNWLDLPMTHLGP